VSERTTAVLGGIDRVRKRVEDARDTLFTVQDRVSRYQSRANDQRESLKRAMALAVGGLLTRDAPLLWGHPEPVPGMAAQPGQLGQPGQQAEPGQPVSLSAAIAADLAASHTSVSEYFALNHTRLTLLPVIVLIFLVGLWVARRQLRLRMEDEPELKAAGWLFDRPMAATLLATVLCSPWVLQYAPREINLLLLAIALPATILILRRVIEPRLAPFLYTLLVLYALSRMLELLDAVPALERALFQVQMLATVGLLAWLLRRHHRLRHELGDYAVRSVNWTVRGIRTATVGFAVALVADVLGYTNLGRFVADATLGATYTAVILYAGVQVAYGLIRLGLNLWPLQNLSMVRNLKSTVERRARLAVRWAAFIVWMLAALDLAALLEPARDGLKAALAAQYQVGELGLSLGAVLTFVLTIWGAILVSRLARFVLDEEIFTRLSLPRGIPYALTTILHYVLLVGGVLAAIVSTGINLDRFTIIAGAVGVGVGFGLQGIVNNFVSGLILLFERPIKVGDSIEMANRGGLIQRIGIRACVMRTGDGAEVIVPNSMMIAGEVTNWTLSDRQRRLEIPVGVAYGNDPERVIGLLTQVASEHPDILSHPPPETQFAGFGPQALEFKVGAWTGRPERGGGIRSELCVQIYKVLTREGIEIPYPQSTLRLRGSPGELETVRVQGERSPLCNRSLCNRALCNRPLCRRRSRRGAFGPWKPGRRAPCRRAGARGGAVRFGRSSLT
jgi:small-conductance mechanosensitive channel